MRSMVREFIAPVFVCDSSSSALQQVARTNEKTDRALELKGRIQHVLIFSVSLSVDSIDYICLYIIN